MKAHAIASGLVVGLWLALSGSNTALAVSCSSCFTAGEKFGYAAGCSECATAGTAAMETIRSAIVSSETAILGATGMSDQTGTHGFPLVYNAIRSSNTKQTKNLRDALDTAGQLLSTELRQIPHTRQQIESQQLNGEASPDYSESTDQAITRGAGYRQPTPTTLPGFLDWRSGRGFLGPNAQMPDDSDTPDAASGDDDQNDAPALPSQQNVADLERRQVRQINDLTSQLRQEDESTFSELNAGLLVTARNRILGNKATDDDSLSQQQKAQLYLQLVGGPGLSTVRSQLENNSASGFSQMESIVDQAVNDMQLGSAMAVQDRYLRMRMMHNQSYGMGKYMRETMPNAAVVMGDNDRFDVPSDKESDLMSDEAFMALTSTYRSRSPQWMAKVAADSNYAVRSAARIEAERLYTKYQRWQTRREINLMLSQLLAKKVQSQRPESQ